ncbi:MAG TPA: hypothetical protein QGI30_01655 [Anaerolineales bacterium]|nr:hypothetical protein [Anaerolineales bacterium]
MLQKAQRLLVRLFHLIGRAQVSDFARREWLAHAQVMCVPQRESESKLAIQIQIHAVPSALLRLQRSDSAHALPDSKKP